VYRAALEGVLCCSADRGGGTDEFAFLDDRIERGPPLPPEAALEELTHRYLGAYAPATPEDCAAWSGLSMRDVRAGWHSIAHRLIEVEAGGKPAWMLDTQADWLDMRTPKSPVVRLLPRFDTYLLGYRGRELAVPSAYAKHVLPGGGILRPTVVVDGRVVGTWRLKRSKAAIEVTIEPFEQLTRTVHRSLDAEVAGIGRFLGAPSNLRFAPR
jgi:hypothetical protein